MTPSQPHPAQLAVGVHIEEYERRGVDRRQYGEKLLDRLSESLIQKGVSCCDRRELYRYRQFYLTYPQMRESLPTQSGSQLRGTAQGLTGKNRIVEVDGQTVLARLSLTHFVELIAVEDDTKRAFYELECIGGNWSVRELKRQRSEDPGYEDIKKIEQRLGDPKVVLNSFIVSNTRSHTMKMLWGNG